MFPDVENRSSTIGILVPSENLEIFTDILEDILQKSLRKASGTAREKGHQISEHIIRGATFLSNGLVKGAEKTSNFVNNSTPGLLNYINPSQHNTKVCYPVKKGVRVAKNVTSTAADVTCYVGEILYFSLIIISKVIKLILIIFLNV